MTQKPFYNDLRQKSDSLWQAIFGHPFVKGIGDGSLTRDRYEYYLKQDYAYLIDFSRVFALASAKSYQEEEMAYFATLLNATLNMEMDLHRRTCEAFGISRSELEKTQKSLITTSYTNLLVRTCYEGNLADILAVLLPCASGYIEIGQRLKKQGLPEDKHYQDWINTYASEEFADLTQWLIDKMNIYAQDATDFQKQRWYSHYLNSARFEYLFFEMSWTREMWPAGIPS
jgi:thiaminase/transcriptional activator TenA